MATPEEKKQQTFRGRLELTDPSFQRYFEDVGAIASGGASPFLQSLTILPFLQQFGGLFPSSQEAISQLLPEGTPFISPLETGPFGSIGQQFSRQRQLGRQNLAGRGLTGSGAEQSFNREVGLGEANANRQATQQMIAQLPLLLAQARQQALNNRLLREQIKQSRFTGGAGGLGGLGGALGSGAGAGIGALFGGPFGPILGANIGGQLGGLLD